MVNRINSLIHWPENCSLARELSELAAWLAIVYDNNPLGMQAPWAAVVSASEALSVGATKLPNMDTYKILLPQGINAGAKLSSMTFYSVSSRPANLQGLPKDTSLELVRSLLTAVHRDFQTCLSPENYLVREFNTAESDSGTSRVVLLGASNLGYCAERLRKSGLSVVDLTSPGWIASPANVALAMGKLEKYNCGASDILILDLYGNISYRFEQFDGSVSLPYKTGGRYHLAGKIMACPQNVFRKTLDNTVPILTVCKMSVCIVIPPLTRYLFAGCCKQNDHSANVGDPDHAKTMLTDVIGLRNTLKKFVSGLGLNRCRVLDSCCVTDCTATANLETRLDHLRTITASDGVHFSADGYNNLVKNIVSNMETTSVKVANAPRNTCPHFWRGFRSPIGSIHPTSSNSGSRRGHNLKLRAGHGRGFIPPFHPYRKR